MSNHLISVLFLSIAARGEEFNLVGSVAYLKLEERDELNAYLPFHPPVCPDSLEISGS